MREDRGGRRGGWDLGESPWQDRVAITRVADPVYLNRFVLGGAENERRLTYLPVQNIGELQAPGVYFALMRRVGAYNDDYDTAIFFVSDIGLHLRAYGEEVFVHTASLQSGAPLGDVALEVLGNPGDRAMLARAAGITHFDTAHVYTGGESEWLLGGFVAGDASVQVATKLGYDGGAGRANLVAQFDESRRRLGMDAVDLVYLHRFDPATPLEETLGVFADWQARGWLARIGLSNFAAWQVMKAQAVAHRLGTKIDAIQPMYSLVKRQAEVELLPMAADQGITAYTYSPLGGGLLTGKYAAGGAGRLTEDSRYAARYGQGAMAAEGLAFIA